jgi:hypothetical protein
MASMHRLAQASPEPIPGQGPRLLLALGRGAAPVLIGAGAEASHPNPFTLVGNRTGLANATRLEILDGEAWLATTPTSPRPTGLAAFQDPGSSIASQQTLQLLRRFMIFLGTPADALGFQAAFAS